MTGMDIKPVIVKDITGHDVILEPSPEQHERWKIRLAEFVKENFGVAAVGYELDQVVMSEFYKYLDTKEFILGGHTPFKRTSKYLPWWTPDVIIFLEYHLIPYHEVNSILETGGGNSSIWFAKRVDSIVTIEPQKSWREAIRQWMREETLTNLIVVETLEQVPNKHYDLMMIDSDIPKQCLEEAKWAVQNGCNWIGLDNIAYVDATGAVTEGSGQEAHNWLCNEWGIYKILSDTAFYMRST